MIVAAFPVFRLVFKLLEPAELAVLVDKFSNAGGSG